MIHDGSYYVMKASYIVCHEGLTHCASCGLFSHEDLVLVMSWISGPNPIKIGSVSGHEDLIIVLSRGRNVVCPEYMGHCPVTKTFSISCHEDRVLILSWNTWSLSCHGVTICHEYKNNITWHEDLKLLNMQTRLHLCYETLKRVSNFSELA